MFLTGILTDILEGTLWYGLGANSNFGGQGVLGVLAGMISRSKERRIDP